MNYQSDPAQGRKKKNLTKEKPQVQNVVMRCLKGRDKVQNGVDVVKYNSVLC